MAEPVEEHSAEPEVEMEPEEAEHQPQEEAPPHDEGEGAGPAAAKRVRRSDAKEAKRAEKRRQRHVQAERAVVGEGGVPRVLEELVERVDANRLLIRRGLAKDMRVEAMLYANDHLLPQMYTEYTQNASGFLPALQQLANVASIPGIVGRSIGMPDAHSGYGFAIGNVAAVDADDPHAVVCPGGVGYDINCGVRLIRTDLTAADLAKPAVRDRLADELFKRIPVGVGSRGDVSVSKAELDDLLLRGLEWAVDKGLAWPEDLECCEEGGRLPLADPHKVSQRAKARGLSQIGTLGSGNHYVELSKRRNPS
eukprot:m51a1_g8755 putative trna-splicing ligase homolog (309) ;mRNA; r:102473-103931